MKNTEKSKTDTYEKEIANKDEQIMLLKVKLKKTKQLGGEVERL